MDDIGPKSDRISPAAAEQPLRQRCVQAAGYRIFGRSDVLWEEGPHLEKPFVLRQAEHLKVQCSSVSGLFVFVVLDLSRWASSHDGVPWRSLSIIDTAMPEEAPAEGSAGTLPAPSTGRAGVAR